MLKRYKLFFILIFFVCLVTASSAFGYVAESSHYRLEKDSINFGGTDFSTSSSYKMSDTLGEIATGKSDDLTKIVQAGYRSSDGDYYVAISAPDGINLSPAIDGLSGGTSTGAGDWTIITNNPTGYALYVKSSSSPALATGANSFDDYATAGYSPDYDWNISTTSSAFGFSVQGNDILSTFKNNGTACGLGTSQSAEHCWSGLTTSPVMISSGSSSNDPSGSITSLSFKAEVGLGKIQEKGSYSTNITLIAMVQ